MPHGRLPDEFYVHNKILARERSLRVYMKFKRQISEGPITHRALDRRTLLFLLYNAKFWAKIAKYGHYFLIDFLRGGALFRHVFNLTEPIKTEWWTVSVDCAALAGLLQWYFNSCIIHSFQTLYDAWFISFYNVFFTSAPIVFLAVLDQVGIIFSDCLSNHSASQLIKIQTALETGNCYKPAFILTIISNLPFPVAVETKNCTLIVLQCDFFGEA